MACSTTARLIANVPSICTVCSFAGSHMGGADFSNVVYVGTDFSHADLAGATFRGATLIAANFYDADLDGAALDGATCLACNFQGARLEGATFTGARMTAVNFARFDARLTPGQLTELLSRCVACNFSHARLAGADLSGVPLISVDFSGADLRGVRFDGAILCWYGVAAGRTSMACDAMHGAQATGASFRGVLLCANPPSRDACTPVDADTLRHYTGSALPGTTGP